MRLIIDNALSPLVASILRSAGHDDAVHVRDRQAGAGADEAIVEIALEEDRIVVSADSDFGAILALRRSHRPSFILLREAGLSTGRDVAQHLLHWLPTLAGALASGCVVVFRRGRARIRSLPF